MKKIRNVIACLVLVFALAGCSTKTNINDDALNKFETGIQKIAEVNSMSYEMKLYEETSQTTAKLSGAMSQTNDFGLSFVFEVSDKETPVEQLFEYYIKEKNMYLKFMGIKQKQPLNEEDITSQLTELKEFTFDKEDAKEFLDEAVLDGNKVILKMKTDDINKQLKNTLSTEVLIPGSSMDSISTFTITIEFEDDFIKGATFDLAGKQEKEEVAVTIDILFSDINQIETIPYPEDLDTYPEEVNSALL